VAAAQDGGRGAGEPPRTKFKKKNIEKKDIRGKKM